MIIKAFDVFIKIGMKNNLIKSVGYA